MKKVIFLIAVSLLFFQNGYSQDIPKGAVMVTEATKVKDVDGTVIDMPRFFELIGTGEWSADHIKDEVGNLITIQVRKATEAEKENFKAMSKSHMKLPTRVANTSSLIGTQAPDFSLTDINGNTISLQQSKGKVIVLNFWFTSCKPCIDEIPELNEVFENYKLNTDVVFASITFNQINQVKSFLTKHAIQYPVFADAMSTIDLFGIKSYPTNIVIGKNGRYFEYINGGFPKIGNQVSAAIQNALNGEMPHTDNLPAGSIIIGDDSIFKLENGEIIPLEDAMKLVENNVFDLEPKKDDSGNDYYLLKKKN